MLTAIIKVYKSCIFVIGSDESNLKRIIKEVIQPFQHEKGTKKLGDLKDNDFLFSSSEMRFVVLYTRVYFFIYILCPFYKIYSAI